MDLGTLIGFVLGFGLITMAMILGGGVAPFIDAQSGLIVVGGTFAATLIRNVSESLVQKIYLGYWITWNIAQNGS